ncbi:MAG TPA: TonB-dependent receptor [Vicinamibacterales bacterium]|nr:TonB-dependent receptor [Vicinamibacterales bacterium]
MRMWCVVLVLFLASAQGLAAQAQRVTVRVEVRSGDAPIPAATVVAAGTSVTTDPAGAAAIGVPVGKVEFSVTKDGFLSGTVVVDVTGPQQTIRIELTPQQTVEEEVTVVASTRTGRRVEDQPMRVEVLGREEVEEKMLMTPGDIVMMLNEMGGLRVQATSPSLGAASVRIQGMPGRYTRFLSDGLPLFGEQPGGLGLLQIPPMDLGQVEVIKGVASALYGAGAMGGVVNLVSRKPGKTPDHEVLFNQSTHGATDTVAWLSGPLAGHWGYTLLGGGHWQQKNDVDGDGWADLAGYKRGVVRPRFFWDNGGGRSFFATAGFTGESRRGGTVGDAALPIVGSPYTEALDTTSVDAGVLGQTLVAGKYVVTARAAVADQRHDHSFGETVERDVHNTGFAEVAMRGQSGHHTWVTGAALEYDRLKPRDVPQYGYSFTTPGVFAQDDIDVRRWLAVSLSGRLDHHSEYGTFFSPRASGLLRRGHWTTRVSVGGGFVGPTVLTEETEAAGLSRLRVDSPLRAERGRSASWDVTYGSAAFSGTATVFSSHVEHPVQVERETYVLRNLDEPTKTRGLELLGTFKHQPFSVTATYAYVHARESPDGEVEDVALTPRHSAGFVAMAESPERGRVGLEIYYTGRQRLEVNPYRTTSEPYVIVGLLAERRFGRWRLFINGENLTGVRQSHWNPLLLPQRAVDGRWTVDAWAPLDGRVINGGFRIQF